MLLSVIFGDKQVPPVKSVQVFTMQEVTAFTTSYSDVSDFHKTSKDLKKFNGSESRTTSRSKIHYKRPWSGIINHYKKFINVIRTNYKLKSLVVAWCWQTRQCLIFITPLNVAFLFILQDCHRNCIIIDHFWDKSIPSSQISCKFRALAYSFISIFLLCLCHVADFSECYIKGIL